jgi:hypothetical protein
MFIKKIALITLFFMSPLTSNTAIELKNYRNPEGAHITTIKLPATTIETGGLNTIDFVILREFTKQNALSARCKGLQEHEAAKIWANDFPNLSDALALYRNIESFFKIIEPHNLMNLCEKTPASARLLFSMQTVNSIVQQFPDKSKPIHYISFAAGKSGQALLTILALIAVGYRSIHLSIIDRNAEISYVSFLQGLGAINPHKKLHSSSVVLPDNTTTANVTFAAYSSLKAFSVLDTILARPKQIFIEFCDTHWIRLGDNLESLYGCNDFYTLLWEVSMYKPLVLTMLHISDAGGHMPWPGICQFLPKITDGDF